MSIYDQILEKRSIETTYSIGGSPHTYVELFGGTIIPMLPDAPDIRSYRDNYYYNSSNNILYVKQAMWVLNNQTLDNIDDDSYVYVDGRSIQKLINQPDPLNFGDRHYYNITESVIYSKVLKWVEALNIKKEKEKAQALIGNLYDIGSSSSSESSEN